MLCFSDEAFLFFVVPTGKEEQQAGDDEIGGGEYP